MMQQIVVIVEGGKVTWNVDAGMRLLDAIGALECAKLGMIRSNMTEQPIATESDIPE